MATKPTRPEPPAPPHGDPRHPPRGPHHGDDHPDGDDGRGEEPIVVELRIVVPVPKPG